MAYSDFERTSWVVSGVRSVGMTLAVVAALILGAAAASYARAGGDRQGGYDAPPRADLSVR
ncbi:MAG TPA: hypothetical protein VM925_28450 [Labilithrix sp.]|nr:hypothetical protein [Labilithrix sp.]